MEERLIYAGSFNRFHFNKKFKYSELPPRLPLNEDNQFKQKQQCHFLFLVSFANYLKWEGRRGLKLSWNERLNLKQAACPTHQDYGLQFV